MDSLDRSEFDQLERKQIPEQLSPVLIVLSVLGEMLRRDD